MSKLLTYGILQQKRGNLLLDTYTGAVAAYSIRKIRNAYTGYCIKVRREDNDELDIGFSGTELDTSQISSFIGSGDGVITTWYDQSGNNKHLYQSNVLKQPFIAKDGVISTTNSVNSIDLFGRWVKTSETINFGTTVSIFIVAASNQNSGYQRLVNIYNDVHCFIGTVNGDVASFYGNGSSWGFVTANSTTDWYNYQRLVTTINDGDDNQFINGNTITPRNNPMSSIDNYLSVGGAYDTSNFEDQVWGGKIQELVIYASDKSSDRTSIESNMNNYYSIY